VASIGQNETCQVLKTVFSYNSAFLQRVLKWEKVKQQFFMLNYKPKHRTFQKLLNSTSRTILEECWWIILLKSQNIFFGTWVFNLFLKKSEAESTKDLFLGIKSSCNSSDIWNVFFFFFSEQHSFRIQLFILQKFQIQFVFEYNSSEIISKLFWDLKTYIWNLDNFSTEWVFCVILKGCYPKEL
jgi:hypothetical protein